MATAAAGATRRDESSFSWEGKDKTGKVLRGEMRSTSESAVNSSLRRQGITPTKVRQLKQKTGGSISEKDISLFTRQLATMMKSGVPLLQAFDIIGRGHANPAVGAMIFKLRSDVETGSSLSSAFQKFPLLFDALFCNLVAAGEQAGILESLLDRLAVYKEKTLALKAKIKGAMFYPIAVLAVAFIVTAVIMIFVIPQFKEVFKSFGADLPGPTLIVIAMSEFFVSYWYIIFGGIGGGIYSFFYTWKRSVPMQIFMDRFVLKIPKFGELMRKAIIARWSRTLATMFSAGVPLVEALTSVAGAAGNYVYYEATMGIKKNVTTGTSLRDSLQMSGVFPSMMIQMVSIGEESGSLDAMLSKVADFFEQEVDDAVDSLSALMEPLIMVVLGTIIGGIVIAMYLPIFKLGAIAG